LALHEFFFQFFIKALIDFFSCPTPFPKGWTFEYFHRIVHDFVIEFKALLELLLGYCPAFPPIKSLPPAHPLMPRSHRLRDTTASPRKLLDKNFYSQGILKPGFKDKSDGWK